MLDPDAPPRTDVLIVGAGPTGLTAAIDAHRHGLSVRLVDRSPHRTPHSKALVLHSRSMEVLDDLGCIDRFLSAGREFRALNVFAGGRRLARVEFRRLDWRGAPYPMWFTIPQSETERCLEEHLVAQGAVVERETTLRALRQRDGFVDAELVRADGTVEVCRASWVIGCDGARSDVRRMLGVDFEGSASGEVFVLADVSIESKLADGEGYNILAPDGVLLIVPMQTPGRVRLIMQMPHLRTGEAPVIDLPMLQRVVDTRSGFATRLSSLGWTSVFSPKHLAAKAYRVGRVFLAGDAAHVHSPVGGQGLNTGIQDAYNLVWKLALVQHGEAAPGLLGSYEAERRAVADGMIRGVQRATRLLTLRVAAAQWARNQLAGVLMNLPMARDRMGRDVGMLGLRYPPCATVAERSPRFGHRGGPRPGERAPLLASRPELAKALRGTTHSLLLFDGSESQFAEADVRALTDATLRRAGGSVRVVRVRSGQGAPAALEGEGEIGDPDGAIRRAYGAARPLVVWVRPDKYVGFRGEPRAVDALTTFLRGVFA